MFHRLVVATVAMSAGCTGPTTGEASTRVGGECEAYALQNPILEGGFDTPAIARVDGRDGVHYYLAGDAGIQRSEDLVHWQPVLAGPELPRYRRTLEHGDWRYRVGLDARGIFWYASAKGDPATAMTGTLIDIPAEHTAVLGTFVSDPTGEHHYLSYAEASCDSCIMGLRLVRIEFADLGDGHGAVHMRRQPRGPVRVCRRGGTAVPTGARKQPASAGEVATGSK